MKNIRDYWDISWRLIQSEELSPKYYKQIIEFISQEFENQNYPKDLKMPSIRILADYLEIKKHHVEKAYAYWVKLGKILYVNSTEATYMFGLDEQMIHTLQNELSLYARLPFNNANPFVFQVTGIQKLNVLSLGNTYHRDFLSLLKKSDQVAALKEGAEVYDYGYYLSKFAFNMLKRRNVINNSQQLSIVPNDKALYKVLRKLLKPGDHVVISSPGDLEVMETFYKLHLQPSFTGWDENGMLLEDLERICETQKPKLVLIRPGPDFPVPVSLSQERWESILNLAEKYRFWVLFVDDDYEFSYGHQKPLDKDLASGYVINISPLSKLSKELHRVGLVAGPIDFIRAFNFTITDCFIGWDKRHEFRLSNLFSTISEDLIEINDTCKQAVHTLRSLFINYFNKENKEASLILPLKGTFALLLFEDAIDLKLLEVIRGSELFHHEENIFLDDNVAINAFRISLYIKDWNALEKVFRSISNAISKPQLLCKPLMYRPYGKNFVTN